MNQEQLNAIKQRAEKAEEGTWYLGKKSPNGLNNIGVKGCMICQVFDDTDAEFIVHARKDVPALVAEVERLREVLKGAAVVSNQAKGLVEENKRLRQALTEILDFKTFDLAKFESQVIEIAVQALRGGEKG
ncbi:hypothetical protein U1P98_12835 [Lysinibacillus irui]|uniref:Ead/Ea22-like family protein n=1 Tax=Lysinibacillus irui TaxID=2998077 RepID=A0ABU5NMB5_9BACI|nr:hypothetical protein [Lysinibacillus irui]MEA0555603.1 hypothetical protein [Lysinibacillus irui]MEA0977188.1 hypothetical protein [Lysinibacillus irui]MEA1043342.1 hypothetical protein [Lysinibacillus irui]